MPVSTRYSVTVAFLGLTLAGSMLSERRPPDFLAYPLDSIGMRVGDWAAVRSLPLGARELTVLRPTSYLSRVYERRHRQLQLFIAFYAQQRTGESMHSPKNCLPGSGWEIREFGSAEIPVNGRAVKVNRYAIQNGGDRLLVFYWYQSRQRMIASEYLGKILLVRDALFDGRTAGSIVRVTLPERAGAAAEGASFASAVIPEISRCFGRPL